MNDATHRDRRSVLKGLFSAASAIACAFWWPKPVRASSQADLDLSPRFFDFEEKVDVTLARLFQDRPVKYDGTITLVTPQIAENGRVVPIEVKFDRLAADGSTYPKNLFVVVDNNRRPLSVVFGFTPATSGGYAACNLRMGESSPVRVIVETSSGELYGAFKHVNVVAGGCGG